MEYSTIVKSNNKVANNNGTIKTENNTGHLPSAGEERLKADYRMFGSLLLILGLCATYASFANIVTLAGNPTVNSGLPLADLVSVVVQCFFGLVCMVIGFAAAIMDIGNVTLTTIAAGSIQMAWLPFLVGLSSLVKGSMSDPESNPFIPNEYNPTVGEVRFIGTMSFLALIAYAIGFIGSLGFMAFSMHAIQKGKPEHRSGLYFRGRAKAYNLLYILAGFTQCAIGFFVMNRYEPLHRPITPGIYGMIFFPEISIAVGVLQCFTGGVGLARSFQESYNDLTGRIFFQVLCLFAYVCMVSMQILSQLAYAPSDTEAAGLAAALAPSEACVYFGLAFMPAFLDWKMNTVPENLKGYYQNKVIDIVESLENGESINVGESVQSI